MVDNELKEIKITVAKNEPDITDNFWRAEFITNNIEPWVVKKIKGSKAIDIFWGGGGEQDESTIIVKVKLTERNSSEEPPAPPAPPAEAPDLAPAPPPPPVVKPNGYILMW